MNSEDNRNEAVDRNFLMIKKRGGEELDEIFGQKLPSILQSTDSPHRKYLRLVQQTTRVLEIVKPNSPCKRGCSHCCHMATTATEHEATRIAAYTGVAFTPQNGQPENPDELIEWRNREVEKYTRVPCVFLGAEGECTIYPVRPLACRAYHSIEADEKPCKMGLAGERLEEVAQINTGAILMTQVMIDTDTKFADIRDWFPKGTK